MFYSKPKGLASLLHRKVILLFILLFVYVIDVQATHLRAGQITVEQVGPRKFLIRVEVWTNTRNTTVLFGGDQDVLDFGDGTSILVPETQNMQGKPGRPPLPPGVAYAYYEIEHTYPAPGVYTVSYREPNRNEGVLNMAGSVNTTFYLETQLVIDPFFGPNNSPKLEVDPIDIACPGVAFTHNPGAYDPDPQDSISYSMEIPFSDRRTQVIDYRSPNDPKFYTDYNNASESGGPPTFNINQVTGTITWDAPGAIGEYNIAFHVIEWRKLNGKWERLGYVRRDMQILVEDCQNERPELEIPPDTCIVAGTKLIVPIIGTDKDGHRVKIEAFSPIFNLPYDPAAILDPNPAADSYVPVPAESTFTWQTECENVRDQPYTVVFKITDNPPEGPQLVTFKTWFITVVGPAPEWDNYSVPIDGTRNVTLNWNEYECANAESMQVWRKVDGSDFEPDICETGMPPYLGYQLVGTVPIANNTFTDTNNGKGLAVGARYCYRLVAVFPAASGSESLVSQDICIEPFKITTPVITNVSVIETASASGSIEVRWTPPLEHPTYPAAYTYRIYRSTGFTRADDPELAGETNDLVFTDNAAELNTEEVVYNYSVEAVLGGTLIGKSEVASAVRLETSSRLRRIELSWNAIVPWSNNVDGLTHRIYRGEEGATSIDDMQFLTEVNVSDNGFTFIDEEVEEKVYCYLVETYGSYGNAQIPSPLINRSQIICAEPGDEEPPCKIPLTVDLLDCEEYIASSSTCRENEFPNVLRWTPEDADCNDDIDFYRIYYANSPNGDYTLIAEVRGTMYEDLGRNRRTSYAACYRIAAVDRSGNVSEMSDPVCVENCPYYELPNVFTPNGDNCNDLFSAYSSGDNPGEDPSGNECVIPPANRQKCARFVEKVVFRAYNRWGREVYTYTGASNDDVNNIWINWDGRSNEGQMLSSGVYYYVAEVTFIAIDPKIKFKTLKGWVHLLRDKEN